MIVNGVTLPDIPAEVLKEFPYLLIFSMTTSGYTSYAFMATESFFGHAPGSLFGAEDYEELVASYGAGVGYFAAAGAAEWTKGDDIAVGEAVLPNGIVGSTTHEVIWANHNVYEITAYDSTTGAYTKGDIWFGHTLTWPALPDGVFDKYPYGMISYCMINGEQSFYFTVAPGKFDHLPDALTDMGFDHISSRKMGYTAYECGLEATEWTLTEEDIADSYAGSPEGLWIISDDYTFFGLLVWANHDIYTAAAVDMETKEVTPGTVLLYDCPEDTGEEETEGPTRYSIAKTILDDIAKAIAEQRKTDRKYKPEEFAQQIRRMFTLPAGWAESALRIGNLSVELSGIAVGVLPTVHNNVATSTLSVTSVVLRSSGVGILTE